MRLTHFGHAAVLVETSANRRALFDPGTYSQGFEDFGNIDVILVTHAHPDHLDMARFPALRAANPYAALVANAETLAAAGAQEGDRDVSGASVEVGGIRIEPTGQMHATIYPGLPSVANTGFILDGEVWHPGDAFDAEPRKVDVLLLPVGGPWMKIAEAIDFARAVDPRVVVPIHQAGLAEVHRQLHYGLLRNFVPAELVILEEGITRDI